MLKYIAKRMGYGALLMIGVVHAVFFLYHALPGDPVSLMAGTRSDPEVREAIRKDLGLDLPLHKQLLFYINDLSFLSFHDNTNENEIKYEYIPLFTVGNTVSVIKRPYFRRSFQTNQRVDELILENLEGTIVLAFVAMLFASVVGITFGIIAALNKNSFWDHLLVSSSVLGISAPSFISAILISMLFGYYLNEYTGLDTFGQLWVSDPFGNRQLHLENVILPALTLGIRPLGIIIQLTRSSLLDVISQDFIRTAKAKGLSKRMVILKHALKNALNPVITAISGWLAMLMAGAFFVEYIFNWKGLGFQTLKAVEMLDFPVVMGATITVAVIFIFINIIVDILYALIDPRVKLG